MSFIKNLTVIGGNRNSPKSGIKIPFQGVVKLMSQTETERDRVQTQIQRKTDGIRERQDFFPTSSSDMEKNEKSEFKPAPFLIQRNCSFS